jgi:hypothetical protein
MTDRDPTLSDHWSEEELQASSRQFLIELEHLTTLERRKREMDPSDPRRLPLAHEIEDASVQLMSRSRYQTRLVLVEKQSRGEPEAQPRRPHEILEDWRGAERRLHEVRSEMERAIDDADRLRDEHRRSVRSEQPSA